MTSIKKAASEYGINFTDSCWTEDDIKFSIDACESYGIEDEDEAAMFMNAFG